MKKNFIYQPLVNEYAQVINHEKETFWSFQVWRSKQALLKIYPNCIPVIYNELDIEEPTFMD